MFVTVYSISGCQPCSSVKKFLEDNKIEHEVLIVGEDATKEEFQSVTDNARSVPQILVDGYHLSGGFEELKSMVEIVNEI